MAWLEQLKPKQREALDFIVSRDGTLLLGDTGTGKTYITLAAIETLRPAFTLLVVPLTSLDIVWSPKLARLEGFRVVRDPADLPRRPKNAPTAAASPLILLLHHEAFRKFSKRLSRRRWNLVAIDESHILKARGSGMSRAARRFRDGDVAERRLALSATPLDKTPIDLFGQMRFVDHNVFGEDFTPFAEHYCYRGGWKGHKWMFRAGRMREFLRELSAVMFRLTDEFMNLPPLTIIPSRVRMLGNQRRLYEQMDKYGITYDPDITARLPITKQVKLEQITGGIVIDNNDRLVTVGHAKERRLRTILKQIEPPFVVFCKYLHEVDMIRTVLEERFDFVAELRGRVKGQHRTDVINAYQDGRLDAVVCQVRTGGVSVEFTRGNVLVFYSFGFSFIDFTQILGRVRRGGQTRPVTAWVLYADGTVDEDIIDRIDEKRELFHSVAGR